MKSKIRKKLSGQQKQFNKNATPLRKRVDVNGNEFRRPTHTNKIEYTPANDGHKHPARIRHAATKMRQAALKAADILLG